MKLRRLFFTFLLLLAAFKFCFSQEKSRAILFAEVSKVDCEFLQAKIDGFIVEVLADPNSTGYAVIYGRKQDSHRMDLYRKQISNYVDKQVDEKKRILVVKGINENSFKVQLWKVPLNADEPFHFEDWNLSLPKFEKSINFYADSWENSCLTMDGVSAFSNFLLANPTLRGHLVVKETTLKKFRETENKLLEKFERKYGIAPNRLKMFYIKARNDFDSDVEYWLVRKN